MDRFQALQAQLAAKGAAKKEEPVVEEAEEDRKVGPIPLPVFIPMCIFTPSLLASLGYFMYLKTVKKYNDKKQLAKQDEEAAMGITKEVELSVKVEKQIREFIYGGQNK
ncbi:hypothetical protein N0V86_006444 [Didymella sp. IMI 355093]|nr:hypothetical protein N0V86_006444 [Didymella sp. IMI 355093]